MIKARLRSLFSVPILLLFIQNELESASLPIQSISFSGNRIGPVLGRDAAAFDKSSWAARKLAVTPSRFRLLTRRLALDDSGALNSMVRRNIAKILGCLVLVGPPGLEIYSRSGSKDSDFREDLLPQPSSGSWGDVQHVTLVFHGSGGPDNYTDMLMQNLKRSRNKESYSSMIDWRKYSSNILQASFSAHRIGRCAAQQLLERARNLQSVHVIGISVGAFAADSVCHEVKASLKDSVDVQLTLLDPFTQRGILDVGYGARKFGDSADYFQQFLNTDDPVPFTNTPLAKSVCYDITAIRPEQISFGHDWPAAYYAQQKKTGIVPLADRLPRGTLIRVER